jgi:hypothetical protein
LGARGAAAGRTADFRADFGNSRNGGSPGHRAAENTLGTGALANLAGRKGGAGAGGYEEDPNIAEDQIGRIPDDKTEGSAVQEEAGVDGKQGSSTLDSLSDRSENVEKSAEALAKRVEETSEKISDIEGKVKNNAKKIEKLNNNEVVKEDDKLKEEVKKVGDDVKKTETDIAITRTEANILDKEIKNNLVNFINMANKIEATVTGLEKIDLGKDPNGSITEAGKSNGGSGNNPTEIESPTMETEERKEEGAGGPREQEKEKDKTNSITSGTESGEGEAEEGAKKEPVEEETKEEPVEEEAKEEPVEEEGEKEPEGENGGEE